jgi:hypothetical protein
MTKRQHIEAQRLKPMGVAGIEACRRIATEGPMKINEVFVDAFTASAIVAVYDALNEANRANLAGRCVGQVAEMCFKLINRRAA